MQTNLVPLIRDFMKIEKIDFSISEDNSSEFWVDDLKNSITIRFKVDASTHDIFYDVYSSEYSVHLKEETIKDVENLEFLAEENKRWRLAESIEDIWLILDRIKIWARQNNFNLIEKHLI